MTLLARRIIFFTAALLLLAVLGGCNATSRQYATLPEEGAAEDGNILRVGLTPDYPPVIYIENKRLTGLEIDYAAALGPELGRRIRIVPLKFVDLIPALEAHDIDIIMSGMSITRLRSVRVAFCEPYLQVGQMVLVRTEDRVKYGVPQMMVITSDRIGVLKGTTGDIFVSDNCENARKIVYQSPDNAILDLKDGSIDMLVMDAPQVWMVAAENEAGELSMLPFQLTEEYLAWAVNKEDQRLLEQINNILKKWRQNGTISAVNRKWLPFYKQ